jgi:hypothetical protein
MVEHAVMSRRSKEGETGDDTEKELGTVQLAVQFRQWCEWSLPAGKLAKEPLER